MIEFKKQYKEKLWHPNHVQWWQTIPKKTKSTDINFNSMECRIRGVVYKSNTPKFKQAFASERMWELLND